jgi:2-polyprenyl-6-hydroxyphenyl methylase/3-demethylubiquinone-9 3-methyltransferase
VVAVSSLDGDFVSKLGRYDVVYSWGVLHHTGDMYRGLANAAQAVDAGGRVFVAIYNDQGAISRYWTAVKRLYNRGRAWRLAMIALHVPYLLGARWVIRTARRRGSVERGMSLWHDMIDWLGGYPFEVAKPEQVFAFFAAQGFSLERMKTCGGKMGCNEFVFRKGGLSP